MNKENKELIKRMQNNERPNYQLTDEEFKCLEAVGLKNREIVHGGIWPAWKQDYRDMGERKSNYVHRIKADYKPERGIVKVEVFKTNTQFEYKESYGCHLPISYAHANKNFYGLEFSDGTRILATEPLILRKEINGVIEAPKYILFWEDE